MYPNSPSINTLNGVGPKREKELNNKGVWTVADLITTDGTQLAIETGISEQTILKLQDEGIDSYG